MHFKKIIAVFLLVSISFFEIEAGIRCDLMEKLSDPKILNDAKFWEEYSALSSGKKLDDRKLEELLKKFDVESSGEKVSSVSVQPSDSFRYSTTSRADKEIRKLPPILRKHYEDFMSLVSDKSGVKKLYENPGRWHMEKLKSHEDLYSVRLNGGYRVLFQKLKDGIEVLEVNREKVHAL